VLEKIKTGYVLSLGSERERHWPGVMPVFILKNREK
jgi:hypothetical protein